MSNVVVIGAGLSGLSAASQMVADGHDVTIVERDPVPGGRSGVIEQDGFRFDSGPTVLTMPHLIERAFTRLGTRIDQHLTLKLLDPAYRAVYHDGSELLVRHGVDAMANEIAQLSGTHDAAAFRDFAGWTEDLYRVEMPSFIERNFNSPLDLMADPVAALRLVRRGGFGRLGTSVGRRFRDDRLTKLFTFQAMYAGLAPSDALALYAVITYMDSIAGVYFPEGGMHAVPTALAQALIEAGAHIRYDSPATEIIRDVHGRVAGVACGADKLRADAVVVTADLSTAYQRLLPDLPPPRSFALGDYSPSAVVWHVGVRGAAPAGAAHHNIHFARAWDSSFDELIKQKRLMSDPSRLVTIPTLDEPSMAPEGHTALYVLEPVPHLGGDVDWTRESGPMRERLLGFLQAQGYPTDIVTERLVTPDDWAAQGMAMGTPFSLAHTFAQTGPFRPRNHEPRVPGVFFAGTGTTPGVGVPMVLVSGELAAQRVADYLDAGRRAAA